MNRKKGTVDKNSINLEDVNNKNRTKSFIEKVRLILKPEGQSRDSKGRFTPMRSSVTKIRYILVSLCAILLFAGIGGYTIMQSSASSERNQVVSIARSQIGQKEWSKGVLEYTKGNKDAWCAYFVSWVYNKAGKPLTGDRNKWEVPLVYRKVSGVPNIRDLMIFYKSYKTKESGYKPRAGDIVIFARNRSHTGIIEKITMTQKGLVITTIEGNTDTNNVARRNYSINDKTIDGYGVPLP